MNDQLLEVHDMIGDRQIIIQYSGENGFQSNADAEENGYFLFFLDSSF